MRAAPLAATVRPRHVLMTTDTVGGVWRYCVDLARALNAAGTRVLLVAVGPKPSAAQCAEIDSLAATRLVRLEAPLDWMAGTPDELAAVPTGLAELAAGEDVDLIHVNQPSQAFRLETWLPVVAVSHSCVVTWWQAMRGTALPAEWQWQFEMNKAGLERADLVLAPTASHAEALVRAFAPSRGPVVVPNAVAAAGFEATQSGREPFVLAAARWWDEGKNAAILDAAAKNLAWPVYAAGACRGDNGQSFTFEHAQGLGARSHEETRALMQRAAIFVSPSLYEPFGLAALEAAEAGAALVMADIATYRELWDGAALFADPTDADDFTRAVALLIADETLRGDLGRAARERAARFTPERQVEELLAAYGTVLADRADPAIQARRA